LVDAYNKVHRAAPIRKDQSLFGQFRQLSALVKWTQAQLSPRGAFKRLSAMEGYHDTYPLRLQRAEGNLKGYTFGRKEYGMGHSRWESQPFAARGRTYGDDIGYDQFGRYYDYEMDGYYDGEYDDGDYYDGDYYDGDYYGDDYYDGDYYDGDNYGGYYDDERYFYAA